MAMRRMVYVLMVLFVSAGVADAENHDPVVSNVQAIQRPGTMLVDITFDVYDVDGDTMAVTLQISDDGGQTFQVLARTFEGEVGPGVTSGTGKHVVWNAGVDVPNVHGTSFCPKIIAGDGKRAGVVGETMGVTLPGGAALEMIRIEAGTFLMGSPDYEVGRKENEGPQHQVVITRSFYLGRYEVTQGQWESVMGTKLWWGKSNAEDNSEHAASYVSWNDAQHFIGRLNAAEGATVWRLPTEAEWEYACRAGTTTRWSFGDDVSRLGDYAWYDDNASKVGEDYAHKVGTKLPNPWGLYDMHGNVYEWMQDMYGDGVYPGGVQIDPVGPGYYSSRVIRGCGSGCVFWGTRSANRDAYSPSDRSHSIGFRLLRLDVPLTYGATSFALGHLFVLDTRTANDGSTVADNHAPAVSNVQALQRPGTMLVDITYDVFDADGDAMTVTMQMSDDDGQSFHVQALTFEGDVGPGVASGTGKHVVWNAGVDVPNVHGTSFRPKVIADDGRGEGVIPQSITVVLPGGGTMEMVWIAPGKFVMGTTDEQAQLLRSKGLWRDWFENEMPAHEVTITKGFYMAEHEVTQAQWLGVMGTKPWADWDHVQESPDNPAVCVSWEDAMKVIRRLNAAEGAAVYRLPTGAEWEYACRAGTATLWFLGDDEGRLGECAWYLPNAWNAGERYAHRVGTKRPNPWGLYDMHSNVWEWVQDWDGQYSSDAQVDPVGPTSGSSRVVRGGAFACDASDVRSAFRESYAPSLRAYAIGFRLVRQDP